MYSLVSTVKIEIHHILYKLILLAEAGTKRNNETYLVGIIPTLFFLSFNVICTKLVMPEYLRDNSKNSQLGTLYVLQFRKNLTPHAC